MKKNFFTSVILGGLLISSYAQAHIIYDGTQWEVPVSINQETLLKEDHVAAPAASSLIGKARYQPSVVTSLAKDEQVDGVSAPAALGAGGRVGLLYRDIGASDKKSSLLIVSETLPNTKTAIRDVLLLMIRSNDVFHITIDKQYAGCESVNTAKSKELNVENFKTICAVNLDSVWIRQALYDTSKISLGSLMNPLSKYIEQINNSQQKQEVKNRAMALIPKKIQRILTNIVPKVNVNMTGQELDKIVLEETMKVLFPGTRM